MPGGSSNETAAGVQRGPTVSVRDRWCIVFPETGRTRFLLEGAALVVGLTILNVVVGVYFRETTFIVPISIVAVALWSNQRFHSAFLVRDPDGIRLRGVTFGRSFEFRQDANAMPSKLVCWHGYDCLALELHWDDGSIWMLPEPFSRSSKWIRDRFVALGYPAPVVESIPAVYRPTEGSPSRRPQS